MANKERPLRLPKDSPQRIEFESNPSSPILRFLPGHSQGIMAALHPFEQKIQEKIPTFPNEYMKFTFDEKGNIKKYIVEVTAEEFTEILVRASEGLPETPRARRQLIISPFNLSLDADVPSNSLLGAIAHEIEQELANLPLDMFQEALEGKMPVENMLEAIRERIQFVHGLQDLQKQLKSKGKTLGLSDRSRDLLEEDTELIPELTRLFQQTEKAAPVIFAEKDREALRATIGMIWDVTSPTNPATGKPITVADLAAETARMEAIFNATTQPGIPIVQPPAQEEKPSQKNTPNINPPTNGGRR